MNQPAPRADRAPGSDDVRCPCCSKLMFDGEVILSRVVKLAPAPTKAKCRICGTWVTLPSVGFNRGEVHGNDHVQGLP